VVAGALALACAVTGSALADFPYRPAGGSASDPSTYHVNQGTVPNDVGGDGNDWKFASTPEAGSPFTADPMELNGVRGGHLADASNTVHAGWETTTGRPDVSIAVLDSGIKWNDAGAMNDLRFKVRLNTGELPQPQITGPIRDASIAPNCSGYTAGGYDVNGDSVVNIRDYACDPRVSVTDHHEGPAGVLTPQDLIVAFSSGAFHGDGDNNGYVDDIAGWDFLDSDNDPFDDVQYSHGTGEALDSSAEANNNGQSGSCPNCTVVPLRVGDSFVADVNRFGQAVIYATDNNVLVVQEALGTLNRSTLGQKAIDYAYDHGVAVIASAADEAAQHHNWPSSYSHTIVVNSVRQYTSFSPDRKSYLQFNGCTNFSTHVTLAIPSSSCSSNATGVGAGMAGIVYSAALNANDNGRLARDASCTRTNGQHCVITANEVRQLMASGVVSPEDPNANVPADAANREPGLADDINFTRGSDASCTPVPTPGCTDPNRRFPSSDVNRPYALGNVFGPFRSYPAHKGFDQYYGYGRVNMVKAADAANAGNSMIPPTAEITGPDWYRQIDPGQPNFDVTGQVGARADDYTCVVQVAPGSDPNNSGANSDFQTVSSNWCDGTTARNQPFSGVLAQVNIATLKSRFPPGTDFTGPETPPAGTQNFNNRPNAETYGFTVRVVVTRTQGAATLTGQDRRNFFLHKDKDSLPGFPKELGTDGASSPALADLDGDNKNEAIFGTSDGDVHAMRPDGTEAPGWPVKVDALPLHTGGRGFTSGEVSPNASHDAILASPAVGDIDHDGVPEVVVADFEGKLYVYNADGSLKFKREANVAYSGKPLNPFENVRQGVRFRTQHGFFASPVLANLDNSSDRKLEIVAANMDRHVYAWDSSGAEMPGFPVTVVDRSKITAIDPVTNAPTFKPDAQIGGALNQGAIIDTPAVADITGDGKPEIIVGTNEEYPAADDGGFNAGAFNTASLQLLNASGQLDLVNSRVYAIKPTGDPGGPADTGTGAFVTGWPVKVGDVFAELLPVVGEGVTGSPIVGTVNCPSGGNGPKVGALSVAGPGYLFNPNGTSCYGQSGGHDTAMGIDAPGFAANTPKYDTPVIPAAGQPSFASLDPTNLTFLAPSAGLLRALDLGLAEYQGGQDFTGAWNASTGEFRPGFPTVQNDLSFLTGPTAGNVDSVPGDEVLSSTASLDLNAFTAAGAYPDPTRWPKLTGDWSVTQPLIGSFGQLETDSATHNRVIQLTRAGTVFAYDTPAPACPLGSWPRFHHDNASSGDFGRDAVSPGKPTGAQVLGNTLAFKAPGDDLLCGTVNHYEVVTSDTPPSSAADFAGAAPYAATAAPGADQSLPLNIALKRYVAVRAVDDKFNVGRVAVVDRGAPPGGGNGGNNGGNGGGNNGGGCTDRLSPRSAIARKAFRASRKNGFKASGTAGDRGCAGLRRINVVITRFSGGKCQFVRGGGGLTHRRKCQSRVVLTAHGTGRWSISWKHKLPSGRYRVGVRGVDKNGNTELRTRTNTIYFKLK
jgi:hypothetical protein